MADETSSIIAHIESYLGKIQKGWSTSADGTKLPFQIIKCNGGQLEHVNAFCTLGLSDHPLASRVSKKIIRQELMILAPELFGERNIPSILQQVGLEALRKQSAYLRGDVIERETRLFSTKTFNSLYMAIPMLLPDSFSTFADSDGNHVVFVWLVPITSSEASLVRARGWGKFEDLLIKINPDLTDFDRRSIAQEAHLN